MKKYPVVTENADVSVWITTHVFISVDIFFHYGTKGSYALILLYLFRLLPRRLIRRTKESKLKGKKKKRGKEN